MKLLFDFFPIALFFGVYRLAAMFQQPSFDFVTKYMSWMISGGAIKPDQAPMMIATAVAIVATTLQVSYVKLRGRKVDTMLWISFLIITVFGGATIYFHNGDFIKWKPTIIYWVFGTAMLVAQLAFKKNMIRQAMQEQIKLPDEVWAKLGSAWMLFFFLLGAVNLLAAFVIFKDNDSDWVTFKLFGMMGIMFAFIVGQTIYLSKYIEEEKA
ncbi:septation protein A [Massilia sp. CF038]|uniref:septation protein A n=1 Tax=Massilia sp. CF038 TaxID=1881045 RepID=UPI000923B88A|nr:septation protein A [Massilia sp. CF038]SHG77588.1 intracellular septation protein [Massilia sp. CF038]